MSKRLLLATCASCAVVMSGGVSYAATAVATDKTESAASVTEVVVTAEKREQSLQKVPVAISAYTSKARDLQGIESIQDMTNFTPGLSYSTQLDRTQLRGIGRLSNLLSADAAVAVYSDDFFTTSTTEAGRDTLFVDRVEVLRGPQGTLYGRNAIGGAINIISKRPTDQWFGEAREYIGNYGVHIEEAALSGPITDWSQFRIAGYRSDQDDGYFTNLYPGLPKEGGVKHDWYVEGQLQAKIGDKVDLWVKAFTQGWHGDRGGPGSLLYTPTIGPYDTALNSPFDGLTFNPGYGYNSAAQNVTGGCGVTQNPAVTNIRNFCHNTETVINLNQTWAVDFHAIYHAPGFDVKYVTGYDTYKYHLSQDWDSYGVSSYQIPLNPGSTCSAVPGCKPFTAYPTEILNYPENNSWYSHELTVSSTTDSALQWIGGLYYFDETYSNPVTIATDPRQVQLLGQLGGIAVNPTPEPDFGLYNANYVMETRSAAAYGQIDWKVTDTVKLTGGLRYTDDHKKGNEYYRLILMNNTAGAALGGAANLGTLLPAIDVTPFVADFAPGAGICSATTLLPSGKYTRCLSGGSSATTGTGGIEWTPDNSTLGYFRYSRGYKAFAFNAGTIAHNVMTKPEFINSYEIGLKKTIAHNLVVDAAVFYYDYLDAQIPIGVNVGGTIQSQFINIPKARSDGFEALVTWSPIEHLNLDFTYSFNDTSVLTGCTVAPAPALTNGACFVDAADPHGLLPGAHTVATVGGQAVQSVKGNDLPQAPRNKVALNAYYTWEFEPGNLTLSATASWKDKSYASIFVRDVESAPAWGQVDARAIWSGDRDKYEVILFVRNLFDSIGYEAAGAGVPLSFGTVNAQDLTPPRTFGVELHYKFL
jgi:iron complex outermembrane receptor protein